MKKLITILLVVLTFTTFSQNSYQRIITTSDQFFTKQDSLSEWVVKDTTRNFTRVFDISDGNDIIKLHMYSDSIADSYTYFIDKVSVVNNSVVYFCRDNDNYPLIVEVTLKVVGMYYYYDKELNIFQKAERLNVINSEKKFID
jgi:hypothetical protein